MESLRCLLGKATHTKARRVKGTEAFEGKRRASCLLVFYYFLIFVPQANPESQDCSLFISAQVWCVTSSTNAQALQAQDPCFLYF